MVCEAIGPVLGRFVPKSRHVARDAEIPFTKTHFEILCHSKNIGEDGPMQCSKHVQLSVKKCAVFVGMSRQHKFQRCQGN